MRLPDVKKSYYDVISCGINNWRFLGDGGGDFNVSEKTDWRKNEK